MFNEGTIDSHLEDILETIQRALDGLPFDPEDDGSPRDVSLTINIPNTIIRDLILPVNSTTISTADLKEIILSWFEFLEQNNLEDYVY